MMGRKFVLTAAATTALAAMVGSANAAAIIYEPFSQTVGALNGKAGGTGLGTWTATTGSNGFTVGTETLSYGNLDNTGGQVNVGNGTNGDISAHAPVTASLGSLLNDGSTLWFSVMFEKGSTSSPTNEKSAFAFGTAGVVTSFSGTYIGSSGSPGSGIGFYSAGGSVNAAIWNVASNSNGGGFSVTAGSSVFIVGKIVWGATDTITLYNVNPADVGTLTEAGLTGGVTKSAALDQSAFNTIGMAERNSGGVQVYDEIRFGSSFSDVTPPIPEPASLALLAIGGLLIAGRRRA